MTCFLHDASVGTARPHVNGAFFFLSLAEWCVSFGFMSVSLFLSFRIFVLVLTAVERKLSCRCSDTHISVM